MNSPLTSVIRSAIERNGYSSRELAAIAGLPYQTLFYRYKHPGTWRLCEWAAVLRHLDFNDSEWKIFRKEVRKL